MPWMSTTFHDRLAPDSAPSSLSVAAPDSGTGAPFRYFAPSTGAVSVTAGGELFTEMRTVAVAPAFFESVTFRRASKSPPFV